jgi:AcrR family transcriptional regulator
MSTQTRRARQKARVRQEIIDAARDILAREGYEQLSLRKVADRIEYSPTAIYLHFEDKRDLVFQLREDTLGKLVAELESPDGDVKDPVARLRDAMRRYVAFGLRHPQHYVATFVALPHEQLPEDVVRDNSPDSNGMRTLGILRASILACSEDGTFKKVDPDVTARALWASLHGVTTLLIQMPNFAWGDQKAVVDMVIDTAIDGLRLRRRDAGARSRLRSPVGGAA